MNQELRVMGTSVQTPELSRLLSKFESLNVDLPEMICSVGSKLGCIKQFPETKGQPVDSNKDVIPDVLSHLEKQLSILENSKYKLEEINNHFQTII